MPITCQHCGASTASPLVCEECGTLSAVPDGASPFALFGLEEGYAVDAAALKKTLLRLTRAMHPDFFSAAGPELVALAERNTADLNRAHEVLADDAARAGWLVGSRGGPDEQTERAMPQAFLMEVMEWNEVLESAREAAPGSPQRDALEELGSTLREQRRAQMEAVARLLDPLPDPGAPALTDVRKELNAVRYIDRALNEMKALRLEQASSR